MFAAICTSSPIRTVTALWDMQCVTKSAPVSVLAPSTIVDKVELTHGVFPFILHITARR
jgi:hypothetical protein